jgi:ADP-heptose:LPS heptosyltransferase/O-antigen/teichoic acid export membrane protein
MANSLSLGIIARGALNALRHVVNATGLNGPPHQSDSHGRELFLNHLSESLNAGAKILFFAVATPLMLSAWGAEKFGLFAVANSCIALMAITDLGMRTLTRVGLTRPDLSEEAKIRLHALHFAAFCVTSMGAVGIVTVLSLAGCWHRWLQLPAAGDLIIPMATAFTAVTMSLLLLLERIAAAGQLSRIKAGLFVGNLTAFVVVVTLLLAGASVTIVTAAYLGALAFPLVFLLPRANLQPRLFVRALAHLHPPDILPTLRVGRWINIITTSWIFQSYGLVFLISWILGPAAAGTFFLYLKLSELISVLGASASEPTIAALAGAPTPLDRHRHFATSYRSAIALCFSGAVGYTFFCGDLFRIWLHRPLESPYTGLLIGFFGVANGVSRMLTAAGVGLVKPRPIALGWLAGAITTAVSIIAIDGRASPELILPIGGVTALFLLPAAVIIARDLGSTFFQTWLKPIAKFAPRLLIIVAICWAAARMHSALTFAAAVVISAVISALYVFRPPEKSRPRTKNSRLGYDTRSWRSALVMKALDLVYPFRQPEEFTWRTPCVVSSVAGLGDLFIHLPLIAGVVNRCHEHGLKATVALRPAHLEIGRRFGWDVMPFDNGLEDFFKNPATFRLAKFLATVRAARRNPAGLWIDLTGNAVSAAAIKACGARKLAARITRGGKSLTDHPLPHTIQENEYANRCRVADFLGCDIDPALAEKMTIHPRPEFSECVVLCITTASRWKNWPLPNFRSLIEQFPRTEFAVVGFRREVAEEELVEFQRIVRQPNVIDCTDQLSADKLVEVIASSRAVVTNDTSAAHIANFFGKPGAVLFGPVSPGTFAAPDGLRVFHDATCPFHPCVQWKCANPENWCMRKIEVEQVARHLAAVLQETSTYAATAIPA